MYVQDEAMEKIVRNICIRDACLSLEFRMPGPYNLHSLERCRAAQALSALSEHFMLFS